MYVSIQVETYVHAMQNQHAQCLVCSMTNQHRQWREYLLCSWTYPNLPLRCHLLLLQLQQQLPFHLCITILWVSVLLVMHALNKSQCPLTR